MQKVHSLRATNTICVLREEDAPNDVRKRELILQGKILSSGNSPALSALQDYIVPFTFRRQFARGSGHETVCSRLGFVSNFSGSGEPGIIVHASKDGRIGYVDGSVSWMMQKPLPGSQEKIFTPAQFVINIKERYDIDLVNVGRGRLHVGSCFSSGETGIAQKLANILGRPTVGYGNFNEVATAPLDRYLKGARVYRDKGDCTPLMPKTYFPIKSDAELAPALVIRNNPDKTDL
ncbi:hypothetical protein [Pseudomonas sp. R3-52-08]|uniref:hypothetical protein n=1 Tax=Pseudomonas sp. R3-52-08 TaxID=1173284 RepID=UPI000F561398|nr:hypothetical protein [Pseudomonas sp. R3-52-08]AZF20926.1 hypothetical protein C4J91_2176 [Pseudomonas sp. R3-52-08]